MMRARRAATALLFFVLLSLLPRSANAWCQLTTCKDTNDAKCERDEGNCQTTGAPLRWRKLPLHFRFSRLAPALLLREEARASIRAAFYRWSDTLCGPDQQRTALRFVEDDDLVDDKPLAQNSRGSEPFGIYFRDGGWPYTGKADSTLAQTNHDYLKDSGFFTYADMEINTGQKRLSTKEDDETGTDLQSVITHEVGHYIGLDHSLEPLSIMRASYCDGDDKRCDKGKVAARRLAPDDIAAVCALYPPDYVAPDDEGKTGPASCTTTPASQSTSALRMALALAFLAGVIRFTRRSHR